MAPRAPIPWQVEDQEPPVRPEVEEVQELREYQSVLPDTMFLLARHNRIQRTYFYQICVSGDGWWVPYRGMAKRFKDLRLIGRWAHYMAAIGGVPLDELLILAIPEKVDLGEEQKPFLLRQNGKLFSPDAHRLAPSYLGRVPVDWRSEYRATTSL